MRIFVDELPKTCEMCPLSEYSDMFDGGCWCRAFEDKLIYISDENFKSKRLQSCPLLSLADHTKQVRKEVCEEIKKKAELFGVCKTGILKEEYRIDKELLNQIQGEEYDK